jgi:hypothetical protein
MAQREPRGPSWASEALVSVVDSLARFGLVVGTAALLVGVGLLVYNFTQGGFVTPAAAKQIEQNVRLFGQIAFVGGILAALGLCWTWWGEEVLGPVLLLVGAALYCTPFYLSGITGVEGPQIVLGALQTAGIPVGAIGLLAILFDVLNRVQTRAREGARAEQLKIKGLKEEVDIRNVFMGKCWQLPYCRKFVRERCPIYHARRTCWKERVGCMCEESVIRNAMEGKVIPKDIVGAAKFIPVNSKLTPNQKAERCRQCVIYNEHQKHKYRLSLPVTVLAIGGVSAMFWAPMSDGLKGLMGGMDKVVAQATLQENTGQAKPVPQAEQFPFHMVVLGALIVVVVAYAIRLLEYMFFKAKV